MFPIQNSLKGGEGLLLSLLKFALEYGIKKVQENQVGLKLNRTHQLLHYADDVHLLGDNTDTIKKNTETLIDASKEVNIEANGNKTIYVCMYVCIHKFIFHHKNARQNHNINLANRLFENVAKLKYLGMIRRGMHIEFW
jgi:hypothetical protein